MAFRIVRQYQAADGTVYGPGDEIALQESGADTVLLTGLGILKDEAWYGGSVPPVAVAALQVKAPAKAGKPKAVKVTTGGRRAKARA